MCRIAGQHSGAGQVEQGGGEQAVLSGGAALDRKDLGEILHGTAAPPLAAMMIEMAPLAAPQAVGRSASVASQALPTWQGGGSLST